MRRKVREGEGVREMERGGEGGARRGGEGVRESEVGGGRREWEGGGVRERERGRKAGRALRAGRAGAGHRPCRNRLLRIVAKTPSIDSLFTSLR